MDILEVMKSHHNFSVTYYRRNDHLWGNVFQYANGTTYGAGMVADVYYGKADLIAATPSMRLQRFPFLEYIIPGLKQGVML